MNRQIQKTKSAIYNAFIQLLQEHDYSQITVQDIISLANVGRTTFYSHYESKEVLLKELCEELFHHLFQQKRNITLKEYLVHILKHFEQNINSIATLLLSNDPYFLLRFRSELEHDVYPKLRQDYIVSKQLSEEFIMQFVLSSFIETVKWWLHQRPKQRLSAEELLNSYLIMITG
ncbi:TetR/AcrR family transcriptional regulator [Streptococcus didelphis]|uniref:TetR/AcrR family transcriptional regulator n=1 Tax=Streptococcus didelphis TaxID=102886 RepID=A0ABY9LG69_9STRE|nr:TetR/AcrR family transcriptional regulator [Streptococcus didelphis]WMB27873.1 TetR/AcrR family transcriptional regulator [Streptococcus didelphis]WMB29654.1 TetR/AcrR family transcriptional regulator [Streptococcus didelphis]